ncbi:lysophospholipid acyltransferase family protein [Oscillochloris sp. ZM17-4]|uniref:lysophospholipid acyltransferase family protein n=1 Tax=Oscillochloris sp. ZM17-4 TaxID=2866714 RepID=UPI001C73C4DA|nr:lysophospholipid acyltransferase family protein [Oscillochloris sp. ZM17-4]MBX0328887.1 lysophospholipid acyltransferase family protein [Oscillochloris sp. ZM17-4]
MSDRPPRPAIPAAKSALGDELLYLLFARRALRRSFDHVWMQSVGPLPARGQGPFIFYLTHTSWWDAYMLMVIHRLALGRPFDSYVMQEERQLRAYRFFTWCGAFSINRRDPQDVERSLQYAAGLLRGRRDRALYIFPQGRIVPSDRRPLTTYPGVARIVALAGEVTLCPIAMRYEFLGEQWPHAFMRVGPAHRPADPADIEGTLAEITAGLTEASDALRDDVVGGRRDRFRPLLRGPLGIDKRFDQFLRMFRRA